MSDAVNLASRLEGANKFYGTTIIASETTVALAGDAFAWRELDAIRVKGRIQALKIYELLARAAELTSRARTAGRELRRRTCALARPRIRPRGDIFGRSAGVDRPAALFCDRARALAESRPARIGIRSERCRRNSRSPLAPVRPARSR